MVHFLYNGFNCTNYAHELNQIIQRRGSETVPAMATSIVHSYTFKIYDIDMLPIIVNFHHINF